MAGREKQIQGEAPPFGAPRNCNDHFHESDTELHGYKRTRSRRVISEGKGCWKLKSPFNPTNGLACLVDAEEPRIVSSSYQLWHPIALLLCDWENIPYL